MWNCQYLIIWLTWKQFHTVQPSIIPILYNRGRNWSLKVGKRHTVIKWLSQHSVFRPLLYSSSCSYCLNCTICLPELSYFLLEFLSSILSRNMSHPLWSWDTERLKHPYPYFKNPESVSQHRCYLFGYLASLPSSTPKPLVNEPKGCALQTRLWRGITSCYYIGHLAWKRRSDSDTAEEKKKPENSKTLMRFDN